MRRLLVLLCMAVFCAGARPAHANVLDRLLGWVTGSARTQGLSIGWNGTLRASAVELLDTKGTYATFHDVTIVWSPTQLIHRVLLVDSLTADDGDIARLPESSGSSSSSSSELTVKELSVGRLTLEKAVAGAVGILKVDGSYSQDASGMDVVLAATRLDGNGTYNVNARLDPASIDAKVTAKEAANGLVATAAGLPDVGSLDLTAAVSGPRDALGTSVALTAGGLRAAAGGTVDLTGRTLALHITATAPKMTPRPGVAWQSVALDADAKGPFDTPQVNGTLRIQGLEAEGAGATSVVLNAIGNQGEVKLTGELDGVTVPGGQPDILASAPVRLEADAHLSAPGKPVSFALNHPLLALNGTATLEPEHATVDVSLPDLAPLAAAAGETLAGHAALRVTGGREAGVTTVALDGTVGITSGRAPVPALVGNDAKIAFAARLEGSAVTVSRLSFNGADLALSGSGTASSEKVDLAFAAALAELTPVDPRLAGNLKMEGHVSGPTTDLALASTLSGEVSMQGQSSGPFTAKLDAHGLPGSPSGTLTAEGALLGSPVDVALSAERSSDGLLKATITRASWKSLSAGGSLTLPSGATLPQGQLQLSIGHLADFDPLVGKQMSGSLTAELDATGAIWRIGAEADNAAVPGVASVGKAALHVTLDHPESNPVVDGTLALDGFKASGIAGSAHLTAKGPQGALALDFSADLANLDGAPARAKAAGAADVPGKALSLAMFDATWKGQTFRLLAPVRLGFAQGVSINDLRLGIGRALIAVNGTVGQTLALNVRLRDVPADLAKLASPNLDLSGMLNAEAKLGGTPSAPTGTVHATATALRLNTAQGKELPAANVTANVDLRGTSARIDVSAAAGGSHATVTGTAGLSTTAPPLDLRADASLDVAQADPLLGGGTKATGRATLTAAITGTAAKPAGTIRVSANGVRVHGGVGAALPPASLTALATLNGTTARLDARLAASASHLTVAGTAGLSSTGPLDMRSTGVIDLALANPVLEAGGQSVRGRLAIDATARGTLAAPILAGNATLSGGDVRDYADGVHLSDITARLVADGGTLRVVSFDARAGQGTMSGHGTVGLLAPGIPVDLVITARNATPIASDLMTATLSTSLAIRGQVEGAVTLGGRVYVQRALIQVPNKLPASVVTIPTRVAGAPPPKPKPPSKMLATINLDLAVVAPRQVYVRGRGLNAELGGTVRIGGTTSAMRSSGGFNLIRGSFNLVGNTLNFTSGSIDFNGAEITNPALHLVATSVGSNMVATLTVGGTARDPKVTLSSVPPLPQDQILAQILFHTNSGALSPFQLASIAAGLAEISGHGGGFTNPLTGLQNALGLDQLGIGTGANGQPTLQAGRYLNKRVYVGAQQATGGGGAQGTVQVDLTKRLKLNMTVGSGEATSAIGSVGASSGESVGLTYQFEY